jgi:hypothetical protein
MLNECLADVLRSGLFDAIDHFFKMLESARAQSQGKIMRQTK